MLCQFQEASEHFQKAIEIKRDNVAYRENLENLSETIKIIQEEINTYEELLQDKDIPHDSLLFELSKLYIKQRKFHILGHAHLDMAWLWETKETYQVAQRTFKSVLNLQQEYPYLTFCHTTPALYEWIEENNAQ